jgi:hypothetical protein
MLILGGAYGSAPWYRTGENRKEAGQMRSSHVAAAPRPLARTNSGTTQTAATAGPLEGEVSLSVEFSPADRSVHHVRLMTLSFVQLSGADHAFASRVTVCCAELCESMGRKLQTRKCGLKLRLQPQTQRVWLEVTSEATDLELKRLEDAVITTQTGTAIEAYTRALTAPDNELLLSLARVRYEGQLQLSAQRAGRKLALIAETSLNP